MSENTCLPTVFTTSGFVLPLTAYLTPFKEVSGISETLFSNVFATSSDQMLREFLKNSDVYISGTSKKLYDAYSNEPSLGNFMAVVDMVTDTLRLVTPAQFFQWQTGSRHISAISLMFCLDVVTGKFVENYKTYNVLGFNSRFVINNSMTAQDAASHWQRISKLLASAGLANSLTRILTPLMNDRAVFMTFFKHIFVDFY
jgi:hypothetical protein